MCAFMAGLLVEKRDQPWVKDSIDFLIVMDGMLFNEVDEDEVWGVEIKARVTNRTAASAKKLLGLTFYFLLLQLPPHLLIIFPLHHHNINDLCYIEFCEHSCFQVQLFNCSFLSSSKKFGVPSPVHTACTLLNVQYLK